MIIRLNKLDFVDNVVILAKAIIVASSLIVLRAIWRIFEIGQNPIWTETRYNITPLSNTAYYTNPLGFPIHFAVMVGLIGLSWILLDFFYFDEQHQKPKVIDSGGKNNE